MSVRSQAQLVKLAEMVKSGKMTKEDFHRWLEATPSIEKLPERVTPKEKPLKIKTVKVLKPHQ